MNFKEYLNQSDPQPLKTGSVIINKKDIFKIIYKTQREPFTDKKYTHIYICLLIDGIVYTYDFTKTGILKNPEKWRLSVFKLSDDLINEFNSI